MRAFTYDVMQIWVITDPPPLSVTLLCPWSYVLMSQNDQPPLLCDGGQVNQNKINEININHFRFSIDNNYNWTMSYRSDSDITRDYDANCRYSKTSTVVSESEKIKQFKEWLDNKKG